MEEYNGAILDDRELQIEFDIERHLFESQLKKPTKQGKQMKDPQDNGTQDFMNTEF